MTGTSPVMTLKKWLNMAGIHSRGLKEAVSR
jgi:hypothetical protein